MSNSADPDQLASSKPTDLDLHCLQRQGISGLAGQGLSLALCFVLVFFSTFSIAIASLKEERAGLCAFCVFVCFVP